MVAGTKRTFLWAENRHLLPTFPQKFEILGSHAATPPPRSYRLTTFTMAGDEETPATGTTFYEPNSPRTSPRTFTLKKSFQSCHERRKAHIFILSCAVEIRTTPNCRIICRWASYLACTVWRTYFPQTKPTAPQESFTFP
jgi:hypothetical protein